MSTHPHRVFDHVLIIMFENQYRSYVMKNPYMRSLAQRGIDMANYFGCMHPSQTNYIASTAGELCNVTDDDPPPSLLKQRNIVDIIEASPYNLSWKAYMDSYIPANTPWTPDLVPKDQYPYVIKHNPFSSYENIVRNPARWKKIQTEADFFADLLNGTLPNYAWFTPDMWHDGHYLDGTQVDPEERAPALVDQLAKWLEGFFGKLKFPGPNSHLPDNTLVVVTFDEADFEDDYDQGDKYTYDGPNQIYTVLLGDMITPGVEEEGYNHYSLIRTIEKNFGLEDLGKNDRHANWFRFLWGQEFSWDLSEETVMSAPAGMTATSFADTLHVFTADNDGTLKLYQHDGDFWLDIIRLPFRGTQPYATSAREHLHLCFKNEKNQLLAAVYHLQTGWSTPQVISDCSVGSVAITTTEAGVAMLAYADTSGAIHSQLYQKGSWSSAVEVGFKTSNDLTLACLGACILLIFEDADNHGQLSAASYNTADYNVVTYATGSKYSGPYDDTCKDCWGKNAYPVAHFAHGPNPKTAGENEPLLRPYKASTPLTTATLDGVIHLLHPAEQNTQVMSETFSISGLMTPKLPISYQASDQTTTSNGYGSLAQAGWSKQKPVMGVITGGVLCAATMGDEIVLFHDENGTIQMSIGSYEGRF